ncbi:MAG: GtrA family protein [Betaproteobacteria bacterium]
MPAPERQSVDLAQMLRDLLRLRASRGPGFIHLMHSFSLHVATGVLAVTMHYAAMYLLLTARTDPLVASSIGFAAGAATRFALSFFRVFAPTGGMRRAGARFLVAIALQALANTGMLALLLESGLSVWPAQIATTAVLTFATYAIYRLWVFR